MRSYLTVFLDLHQNKDYGTWRVICSGVAITIRGLSTISSIVGDMIAKGILNLLLSIAFCQMQLRWIGN